MNLIPYTIDHYHSQSSEFPRVFRLLTLHAPSRIIIPKNRFSFLSFSSYAIFFFVRFVIHFLFFTSEVFFSGHWFSSSFFYDSSIYSPSISICIYVIINQFVFFFSLSLSRSIMNSLFFRKKSFLSSNQRHDIATTNEIRFPEMWHSTERWVDRSNKGQRVFEHFHCWNTHADGIAILRGLCGDHSYGKKLVQGHDEIERWKEQIVYSVDVSRRLLFDEIEKTNRDGLIVWLDDRICHRK